MEFTKNPFYILAATPRDNRRRLMDLSEERSLLMDADECRDACSVLTNPRRRLAAEVAWLPGVSPQQVGALLELVAHKPRQLLDDKSCPPLARANMLAAGIAHLTACDARTMASWIMAIDAAYEDVEADDVRSLVNADRVVSGFPEVTETSLIEEELENCRGTYRSAIRNALDKMPSRELVRAVTMAAEEATDVGDETIGQVLSDVVDLFEVEAQNFLTKEEKNIDFLIQTIKDELQQNISDERLTQLVSCLKQVLKNWDLVAQPIQVSTRSQGLEHDASRRVAGNIRDLSIELFNTYQKLEISQDLTRTIQEVFAEVDRVAERAAEDAATLQQLHEDRKRNAAREEEFRREITFQVKIGGLFGSTLSMSPEGIDWNGQHWTLDSISRIRWGGTRYATSTTYTIFFGSKTRSATITLENYSVYAKVINALWRAVGVRILSEYLQGLASGSTYRFGSALIHDDGVEFEQTGYSRGAQKLVAYKWYEIQTWTENGSFHIASIKNSNHSEEYAYRDVDNVHVLEGALRLLYKKKCLQLSKIFD